jgi:hypothetical protein
MNKNKTSKHEAPEAIDWMELSAEELPEQLDLTEGLSTVATLSTAASSCVPSSYTTLSSASSSSTAV